MTPGKSAVLRTVKESWLNLFCCWPRPSVCFCAGSRAFPSGYLPWLRCHCARGDQKTLALEISVGSSGQIALMVAPVLVLLSYAIGTPMSLVFNAFEIAAIGLSVSRLRSSRSTARATGSRASSSPVCPHRARLLRDSGTVKSIGDPSAARANYVIRARATPRRAPTSTTFHAGNCGRAIVAPCLRFGAANEETDIPNVRRTPR